MSEGSTETVEKESEAPAPAPAPETPEVPNVEPLKAKAGEKEGIPVNSDGDEDESARKSDARAQVKERAEALREDKKRKDAEEKERQKALKAQKEAAQAQEKAAKGGETVKVREGAFGEVKGIKRRDKAELDGDTIEKTHSNPVTRWLKRN